jgi:hypothetical protein
MKAILVRIGVDQAYGHWNTPVNADGRFVYVPIPEKIDTSFHPGLEHRYSEVQPALERFCARGQKRGHSSLMKRKDECPLCRPHL